MTEFILTLAAVFIVAGVLLVVGNQLAVPPVPVYLVAGLVVGTVFVAQDNLIELALWGIAFLVFVFGTRVDMGSIRSVLTDGEAAAGTQLVIVAPIAVAIGYGLGVAFGLDDPARNALYFAAVATLSSTLVGRELIEADIRNNLVHGRLADAVHFFDDVVAIGALMILSAEVLTDAELVASKIGFGVLFLLAGLLIYRHGYRLLIRAAGADDELVLMGSISILIAFLAAAEYLELSIVVGAFAAGIAVRSDHVESLGVKNGLQSVRDFFAAIFFVTVGALVTWPTLEVLVLGAALIGLVLVVNPLLHTAAFVIEGYDGRTGFLAATNLNQVSELSIVIVIQAWLLETVDPVLFDAVILAAAVTMLASSLTGPYEHRLYERLLAPLLAGRTGIIDEYSDVPDDLADHVVIVGYGRLGRSLVDLLEECGEPYVVIENDPAIREALMNECRHYVFGDAMALYPLEYARIDEASLVVSTVDHRPVSEAILDSETDADRIVRADTSLEAEALLDRGAMFVVVPSVLAVDRLRSNIERVLADPAAIDEIENAHRDYLALVELAGVRRRLGRR